MFRRVFAVSALLTLLLLPGVGARAQAAPPASGKNFFVGQPAMAMLWVAPGAWLMSGTLSQGDDTLVTLTRGYWLGRTEVTQGQWQAVMDYVPIPSHFKGSERPVEQVAWATVMIFCQKLTERERGAGRLPAGYEYTLPTEAEWEYACRAGTTGLYAGKLDAMAWYDANSGGETHLVGLKQPNAWGFHDMHGNVQEWCADWYGGYPGGRVNNPMGAATGQFRVTRGGSWDFTAGYARSAFRHWSPTNGGARGTGFRLALAPRRSPDPMDQNAGR